jgi:hypothetical protein
MPGASEIETNQAATLPGRWSRRAVPLGGSSTEGGQGRLESLAQLFDQGAALVELFGVL